ncbi:DUF2163 domain-containing protein [Meridianimarinicoccus sp. RP-17]|uniref:DUF2163 domain-containing protein n=1 Tax=Meridianimarinicoccus zhengii TaxID=2056810 RepID=UPI000DADE5EF|nr:DUF2163 domain-containing protein [Phycocomes zhengii]
MKSTTPQLAAHLRGPVTTLATCWAITRRDGAAFRFTDHDRDITVDGQVYRASLGYARTALSSDAALSVDNVDVAGLFDDDAITETDMRAGLFDHAEVRIFLVNWADPAMGVLRLRRGWLGEVLLTETGMFRTELRGLTQALQQQIGQLHSPDCRADLGDARCKVNLAALTQAGEITVLEDRAQFLVAITSGPGRPSGWFDGGVLTWTSGPNAGRATEVRGWDAAAGRLSLYLPPGYAAKVGHTFTVSPGCDKRLATCRDTFGNVLNFRGEPYVPGLDAAMQYPDAT